MNRNCEESNGRLIRVLSSDLLMSEKLVSTPVDFCFICSKERRSLGQEWREWEKSSLVSVSSKHEDVIQSSSNSVRLLPWHVAKIWQILVLNEWRLHTLIIHKLWSWDFTYTSRTRRSSIICRPWTGNPSPKVEKLGLTRKFQYRSLVNWTRVYFLFGSGIDLEDFGGSL